MSRSSLIVLSVLACVLVVACKKKGPELTCRVNDVCFVCPNDKEQARCLRDPASSRCKYAEPTHCK